MEPADLVAIALALAAFIGCVNYLWIRLPPAIGMLLGLQGLIMPPFLRALYGTLPPE
jgi:hypothetical protein